MDADRFDRLAKLLSARLPRRGVFGLAAAGLAAPAAEGAKPKPAVTCVVEQGEVAVTTTFTVRLKVKKLILVAVDRGPRDPAQDQTGATTIRRGADPAAHRAGPHRRRPGHHPHHLRPPLHGHPRKRLHRRGWDRLGHDGRARNRAVPGPTLWPKR